VEQHIYLASGEEAFPTVVEHTALWYRRGFGWCVGCSPSIHIPPGIPFH